MDIDIPVLVQHIELRFIILKNNKQINLHENAKGIYFLEIETNDGMVNKKLILQ